MPRLVTNKQSQNTPYVLVAGAAGFLGSHLVESLLLSGAKVIGLDNLITGNLDNIAEFKRHPRFEFIDCDTNQELPKDLRQKPLTHIVSALGQDTHSLDQEATLSSMITGSLATKNLLDLAVSCGATFLLTSSTSVYQGLMSSISLDNYFGSNPEQRAGYSLNEAKRYAEGLAEMYAKQFNLDVRIARLSQVYGPRMDILDGNFLDIAIRQTLQQQDIVIEEEGGREIQLTYISDAIYGISRLLFAPASDFSQSIYPIVNPEKVSILSIAYTLRTYLPQGKDVKFVATKNLEAPPAPQLDIARTKKDLAWEPTVNLSIGLKRTIEYFKAHPLDSYQHATPTPKQLAILPASQVAKTKSQPQDPNPQPEAATPSPQADNPTPQSQGPTLPFRQGKSSKLPDSNKQATSSDKKTSSKPNLLSFKNLIRITILIGLLATYFMWGQPLIHSLVSSGWAGFHLRKGVAQAQDLQFTAAQQSFTQANQALSQATRQWSRLSWISTTLSSGVTYNQVDSLLKAATSTTQGLSELAVAAQPWPDQLKVLSQQMVAAQTSGQPDIEPHDKSTILEALKQTQHALDRTNKQLNLAMIALNPQSTNAQVASATITTTNAATRESIGSIHQPNWVNAIQTYFRGHIATAQLTLSQTQQLIQVLPQLVGQEGSHRYLVMLQNSNELRPTGGFTGSLIELTMTNGQLSYFKVDDIYNPDGQVTEKVPVNLSIMEKEKLNAIPLRDTNWYAHLPTSAQQTIAKYKQATGRQADSVMYLTLNAVKPLISQVGSVYLPEFQHTVTADNFDTLAQAHSNAFYQEGVSHKKEFLTVLFTQLSKKIAQNQDLSWLALTQALHQGLQTKEIQLYSADPAIQNLIVQYDWAGLTKQTKGDYLRVVDANVISNKSNHYVTRSTDYQVNVDRHGRLTAVATITWNHQGQSATWPGGNYGNYLRLYAPLGSQLQAVKGVHQNTITTFQEQDKQVFATKLTIPYNSTFKLTLEYKLPNSLDLVANHYHYQLDWQKQSGIESEDLFVRFNTPGFLKLQEANTPTDLTNGVTWKKAATTDQSFSAIFENIL